ncbi:MAG: efflux RND transporter periplasmic adaptor subunit [Acidobacteria bacterium]|nr:efflux RND transporter periplasmic adaptor subunit [Acidobacteriota bacterium]
MTSKYITALLLVAVGAAGVLVYQRVLPGGPAGQMGPGGGGRPGAGFGGFRGGGGSRFAPQPMLVEAAPVVRDVVEERLALVGNLVGAATVEVAPKVDGRLREIPVRLGDAVTRGQVVGRVEDDELQQQLSQREAAYEVARATVRQREADLALALTTRDRSQSLFARELVARQELDDAEARHQAAQAQLDLARAQFDEAGARLAELRINLENTSLLSPVDGFIGRRYLDVGAYVTSSTAVVSVVDISLVRLVANIVERDLRAVGEGVTAHIEVDAFPDESFTGRVARVAPVLDPATRTAEIEIEIPNPDFRLKPGMYARVGLAVGSKERALVVPREAVVVRTSARGVFVVDGSGEGPSARFEALVTGLEDDRYVEVVDGVAEGDRVVTTGAAGLQHGDPVRLPGEDPPGAAARGGRGASAGASPGGGPTSGGPPSAGSRGGAPPAEAPNGSAPRARAPAAAGGFALANGGAATGGRESGGPAAPAAAAAARGDTPSGARPAAVPGEAPAPQGTLVGAALVEALRSGTDRPTPNPD